VIFKQELVSKRKKFIGSTVCTKGTAISAIIAKALFFLLGSPIRGGDRPSLLAHSCTGTCRRSSCRRPAPPGDRPGCVCGSIRFFEAARQRDAHQSGPEGAAAKAVNTVIALTVQAVLLIQIQQDPEIFTTRSGSSLGDLHIGTRDLF
jgi:hypothetical protein